VCALCFVINLLNGLFSDEYGDSSLSLRSPTGIPPLATDTFPPQVLPDTQAMAKRKRYARWDADPSLIEQDLAALRSQVMYYHYGHACDLPPPLSLFLSIVCVIYEVAAFISCVV